MTERCVLGDAEEPLDDRLANVCVGQVDAPEISEDRLEVFPELVLRHLRNVGDAIGVGDSRGSSFNVHRRRDSEILTEQR